MPRGVHRKNGEGRVDREAIMANHIAVQKAAWGGVDASEIASHVSELDEEASEPKRTFGIPPFHKARSGC